MTYTWKKFEKAGIFKELKCKKHPDIVLVDKINRNMRCIEILAEEGTHTDIEGLIET